VATVNLSTSPTQIDDGTSASVLVTNTGAVDVELSRGGRLRPNQSRTVYPEGTALTAAALSGTGQVSTVATAAPTSQAQQVQQLAATVAGLPGTYAPIGLDRSTLTVTDRNTNALRYFRSQLARRESNPVDIVCYGHSLVEGEGATSILKRGTDRFRDIMRTRFPVSGVTGGYGYLPVTRNATTWNLNSYITLASGATNGNYGLGKHAYFVNATGAKVTLTLNGLVASAIDVVYIQGGGGTFSTKTDTVSNADTKATTGTPTKQATYRIPNVTTSTTSVEANWVSGNSIICGFMIYNGDTASGIRVWNDGQGGLTSTQALDSTNVNMAGFDVANPSLVTITILANDFKTGVAVATSKANLATIVSQVRASAPNASIVFAIEHALGSTGASIPWAQYAQAYYDVAVADGNVAVFDFYQRVGTQTPPTAPGIIYTDQQHYTDAGYLMWADALAGFVSP
jgi:lysophospholipase L1-like esterase